jgi:hypothetical protein
MLIDAVLNPAEIALLPQRNLAQATCVVFDILRATSAMVTGLAHGVTEIWPASTIEEARSLKEKIPDAVLGGERHGDPIEGFAIGNNPLEYIPLAGKRVITTTTNGTVALRACEHAQRVLVGALLNLGAVARQVQENAPADVRSGGRAGRRPAGGSIPERRADRLRASRPGPRLTLSNSIGWPPRRPEWKSPHQPGLGRPSGVVRSALAF